MSEDTTPTQTSDQQSTKKKSFKHGPKDFELGSVLGDGAFGKVVVGTVINENSPQFKKKFAIKIMDKRHIVKNNKTKYVNIEKQVFLKTMDHPFVCHMHFSYQDPYSLYMVLDLCTEDTLRYLIYKYIKLPENLTRIYISEVISALEYMHKNGIYHRDIKPENVLIDFNGHTRLTDFGTAKVIDKDDEKQVQAAKQAQESGAQSDYENDQNNDDTNENNTNNTNNTNKANNTQNSNNADNSNNSNNSNNSSNEKPKNKINPLLNPENSRNRQQSFVGTAQYIPPEMLSNKPFSFAGMDFWALGCLIYQCLVGKLPFAAVNEYLTFKKIETMEYDLPDSLSSEAKDIIQKFLNPDHKNRLGMNGFDEIKNHPFFKDISWDWEDMKKLEIPKRPQTPNDSPIHKNGRKNRESSAWDELDELKKAKATTLELPINEELTPSITRMNTQEENQQLYQRWNKFLLDGEEIECGSAVEQSKLWGMSSERSIMLLTNMRRVLLIDGMKMELKKDIPRAQIVSIKVVDKQTFSLKLVKKTLKFQAKGKTAQQWKNKFDKIV